VKLALVRQTYTPFGGAERFVERALGALREQGADVTIIARRWSGEPGPGFLRCDPFFMGRTWRDRGFARRVQGIIATGRFDLVQSHERIPGCNVFRAGDGTHAQWLALRARHESALGRLWLRLSPWHRYILGAEAEMFRHPELRAVICISRMVKEDIVRHYDVDPAKLHVIYNGIDLNEFHPSAADRHRTEVRAQLGAADDVPVFVYVGSGFARKGVATLIEAAARMRDGRAHFWVVGRDKNEGRYRALARKAGVADRFRFLGPQRDVRPFLGAADAFVLPTLYEPLSNAVLEALACGLPAIVTTTCGAAELVTPGRSGYIFDAGKADALAGHLDRLAFPGVAAGMRDAARAAVADLSAPAMAGRLLDLYRELLAPAS